MPGPASVRRSPPPPSPGRGEDLLPPERPRGAFPPGASAPVLPCPSSPASAGVYRDASTPAAAGSTTGVLYPQNDRTRAPSTHPPAACFSKDAGVTATLRTVPSPAREQQYRVSNEPPPSCADLCIEPASDPSPHSLSSPEAPFPAPPPDARFPRAPPPDARFPRAPPPDARFPRVPPPDAPFSRAQPPSSSCSAAAHTALAFSPTPASSSPAGVRLVEDISSDAKVLKRVSGPRSLPSNAVKTLARRDEGAIRRRQLSTTRTMSQRGKKPTRVVKLRVISKIDAKSYFANERTMYSWVMIGSIILGISLNLFGYISIDPNLADIGQQTGTVLSVLALLIFFHAAYRCLWRRQALSRGMAATAFDDPLAPWIIVALVVAGLGLNVGLAWKSHVGLDVRVRGRSFVPGDGCGLQARTPHVTNPYTMGDPTHQKGRPINCL